VPVDEADQLVLPVGAHPDHHQRAHRTHYRVYDEYLEPARALAPDWFNTYL
jgi:hypothetical protein